MQLQDNISKAIESLEDSSKIFVVSTNVDNKREKLFGCAQGMFEIPDNFDDINIANDFQEEI